MALDIGLAAHDSLLLGHVLLLEDVRMAQGASTI